MSDKPTRGKKLNAYQKALEEQKQRDKERSHGFKPDIHRSKISSSSDSTIKERTARQRELDAIRKQNIQSKRDVFKPPSRRASSSRTFDKPSTKKEITKPVEQIIQKQTSMEQKKQEKKKEENELRRQEALRKEAIRKKKLAELQEKNRKAKEVQDRINKAKQQQEEIRKRQETLKKEREKKLEYRRNMEKQRMELKKKQMEIERKKQQKKMQEMKQRVAERNKKMKEIKKVNSSWKIWLGEQQHFFNRSVNEGEIKLLDQVKIIESRRRFKK